MNDPIPISKEPSPAPALTADDVIKVENARHVRRMRTGLLWFLGVLVLGFLAPLFVFLTRLALGT
jgi:hypothetical protein